MQSEQKNHTHCVDLIIFRRRRCCGCRYVHYSIWCFCVCIHDLHAYCIFFLSFSLFLHLPYRQAYFFCCHFHYFHKLLLAYRIIVVMYLLKLTFKPQITKHDDSMKIHTKWTQFAIADTHGSKCNSFDRIRSILCARACIVKAKRLKLKSSQVNKIIQRSRHSQMTIDLLVFIVSIVCFPRVAWVRWHIVLLRKVSSYFAAYAIHFSTCCIRDIFSHIFNLMYAKWKKRCWMAYQFGMACAVRMQTSIKFDFIEFAESGRLWTDRDDEDDGKAEKLHYVVATYIKQYCMSDR